MTIEAHSFFRRWVVHSISIIHTDKMEKIKGSPYLPNESQDSYEKALILGLKEALEHI